MQAKPAFFDEIHLLMPFQCLLMTVFEVCVQSVPEFLTVISMVTLQISTSPRCLFNTFVLSTVHLRLLDAGQACFFR